MTKIRDELAKLEEKDLHSPDRYDNGKLMGFNICLEISKDIFKQIIDELRMRVAEDGLARLTQEENHEYLTWADAFDFINKRLKEEFDSPSTKPHHLTSRGAMVEEPLLSNQEGTIAQGRDKTMETLRGSEERGNKMFIDGFPTKAKMNWKVGKEQELEILGILKQQLDEEFMNRIKDFLYQIRQNEYRRGKEDAFKDSEKK